jgi:hypothetical protein
MKLSDLIPYAEALCAFEGDPRRCLGTLSPREMVPPQSGCCPVGRMGNMRARSNSIPALPYLARLRKA